MPGSRSKAIIKFTTDAQVQVLLREKNPHAKYAYVYRYRCIVYLYVPFKFVHATNTKTKHDLILTQYQHHELWEEDNCWVGQNDIIIIPFFYQSQHKVLPFGEDASNKVIFTELHMYEDGGIV